MQRKVGDVGLKAQYDNDPNLNILIRCLTALAFVPVNDVPGRVAFVQEINRIVKQFNLNTSYPRICKIIWF